VSARDELDDLRQRVWVLEQKIAKLEAREAITANHRRPSGEMKLELEGAKTDPAPPSGDAADAFRSATGKLPK
jgi:hypothetical protein